MSFVRLHKVSIVSQGPVLFNSSVADNILYGLKGRANTVDIENDALNKLQRMANAHEFVSYFREGYNTLVGEHGVRLSGGQKQRIAIVREWLMDPRVLILDEAMSALDAESENLFQDAMDQLMKGRKVLVIAHRLSTVQSATTVVVVLGGQIVEIGTHEELLKKNGIYASLIRRQLQGSKTEN